MSIFDIFKGKTSPCSMCGTVVPPKGNFTVGHNRSFDRHKFTCDKCGATYCGECLRVKLNKSDGGRGSIFWPSTEGYEGKGKCPKCGGNIEQAAGNPGTYMTHAGGVTWKY